MTQTTTKGPWRVGIMPAIGDKPPTQFRDNDGSFIILGVHEDGETQRLGSANLIGDFKRTERYTADDPVALANARVMAAAWAMREALREVRPEITRVNKLAGVTVFNPAITDLVEDVLLACERDEP